MFSNFHVTKLYTTPQILYNNKSHRFTFLYFKFMHRLWNGLFHDMCQLRNRKVTAVEIIAQV